MHHDLIPSTSIEALLARVGAIKRAVAEAAALTRQAQALYESSPLGFEGRDPAYRQGFDYLASDSGSRGGPSAEAIARGLDAAAWSYLMSESGMLTFMSADAKVRWSKALRAREAPELTLDNIRSTFERLRESRPALFAEGVVEAYRALSWDYKTNNPRMFGKRLILAGYDTLDRKCARVDDLRRVMSLAAGEPEPDHRAGVQAAMGWTGRSAKSEFEDGLLRAKAFKNGNVHVEFKRPDLVEALNRILSSSCPNALPPPRA